MSSAVSVRAFEAHEWQTCRDLRLRALADAPDAFARTLAEEKGLSDAEWSSRLASSAESPSEFSAVAELGTRAVGLAYARIDLMGAPDVAHLYSMWVDPGARRSGVGWELLQAVVSWARSANARRVILRVTRSNAPAVQLYEKAGFAHTQEVAPLRTGSPLLVQTMRLEL